MEITYAGAGQSQEAGGGPDLTDIAGGGWNVDPGGFKVRRSGFYGEEVKY
jgi:hypothetical protein